MPFYGLWLRVRALFLKGRAEDEMDQAMPSQEQDTNPTR